MRVAYWLATYSLDTSYTKANNYLVDELASYPDSWLKY